MYMFLTTRKVPLIAVKCEALIRNLPLDYPKLIAINSVHSKLMAGYYGEKSLDYHLGALNQEKFDIYPGLRLSIRSQYFQIDALVISTHYLLIIEVKNLKGELEFDSAKGQLIQKIDDKINVYDDPFAQVQKQKIHLLQWLEENKFPPIQVETLVVLSNNNALIKKVTGTSVNHWKLSRCVNYLLP